MRIIDADVLKSKLTKAINDEYEKPLPNTFVIQAVNMFIEVVDGCETVEGVVITNETD